MSRLAALTLAVVFALVAAGCMGGGKGERRAALTSGSSITGRVVRTDSWVVNAETLGATTADCASGEQTLAGGFNMSPNLEAHTFGIYPSGQYWRVRLFDTHPSVNMNLVDYAVCGQVPEYQIATNPAVVHADTLGSVAALCPVGKVPIGGGFNMSPNIEPNLYASYPDGRYWRVRLFNTHPTVNMNLSVYAICAPDDLAGRVVRTDSWVVNADTLGTTFADCAPGELPIGGGFNMSPNIEPNLYASYPDGRYWRVRLFNKHPTVNMSLSVYAICAAV